MFDIGGFELLVIAALALIVVGPKELPGLIRTVGKWVAKMRNLAGEFRRGMEDIAEEAELNDLKKIGSVGDDLQRDVNALGADAARDWEQPSGSVAADRSPAKKSEPADPPMSASADEPARDAPRIRDVPVETAEARPAERANGAAAREDDDAFLERFQRGVQGER